MNCHCSSLPAFYIDPSLQKLRKLPGVSIFPIYFDKNYSLEINANCEILSPLESNPVLCLCRTCLQFWYTELAPDGSIHETFAAKLKNREQWNTFKAEPIKEYLTILAFNGFSQDKCRWQDCENHALSTLDICLKHYGSI